MRLYLVTELAKLASRVRKEEVIAAEQAEEMRAQRAADRNIRMAESRLAARSSVANLARDPAPLSVAVADEAWRNESGLPVEIWELVLSSLADVEIDGLRGTSVCARDICNARAACRAMLMASRFAFERLAAQLPM